MNTEFTNVQQKILEELSNFAKYIEHTSDTATSLAALDHLNYTKALDEIVKKDAYIVQLEKQIVALKDENRSFMSVSTIVSLTNENAKLKQTLAGMERSMFRREEAASTMILKTIIPVDISLPLIVKKHEEINDDSVLLQKAPSIDLESILKPDNEGLSFFEKTIKGKTYFVDEENINIYAECNGEVGDIVGNYITAKDGKRKIRWIVA